MRLIVLHEPAYDAFFEECNFLEMKIFHKSNMKHVRRKIIHIGSKILILILVPFRETKFRKINK